MPLVIKPQVTQESFINALTAVMAGEVDFSLPPEEEDDDDLHSLGSISTISSHMKMHGESDHYKKTPKETDAALAVGQMFFFLGQNGPTTNSTLPIMIPDSISDPTSETALVVTCDASSPTPNMDEMLALSPSTKKNNINSTAAMLEAGGINARELMEEKAREADREGLFELGEAMYRRGELLLAKGEVDEAREVLEKAQIFQKDSLHLITQRMAASIHKQGLQHCDRGDKFLAVILLGVAEILKNRPSAENLRLATQVHRGYNKICPKEREFLIMKGEVRHCVRSIEKESMPMARTLHAYAKCFDLKRTNDDADEAATSANQLAIA